MKQTTRFIYSLCILLSLVFTACTDILMGDQGKLDEDIYTNYQTITNLELPFEEEWFVVNGGKTHREGAHHFTSRGAGERYAIDFLMVKDTILENGVVRKIHYSGDWRQNENHYCFGKRLNAPASGKIVKVVNDVEDNIPSNINSDQPGGNYIQIDHINGETSILAHLKKGSIIVAEGDFVVQGQEIGQVGNSGASDTPHLHYQLQGTSGNLEGLGLPAQFLNYYENDTFVARGEPIKNQEVRKN
ncbi:M23 family metallopeptidase [Kordia jejudonensis]|uniref:M23 family metallopeptidase n=1 Tax=Kordia jejudonensis TaxID=1348245 RepID=UPI00069C2570|nr:M23 family metallopeptidase [Kordia jejudonensis]